jgi:CRP-like cAMP-binding protein
LVEIKNFYENDLIISEGEVPKSVFLILEGMVSQSHTDIILFKGIIISHSHIQLGSCIGDSYLLQSHEGKRYPNDCYMKSDGIIGSIELQKIYEIIGGNYEDTLIRNESSHERKMK